MARQPGEFEVFLPQDGERTQYPKEVWDEVLQAMVAARISPEAADLGVLDDPDKAIRLAANHLAEQHGLAPRDVRACFERAIAQAYRNEIPHGTNLVEAFGHGPLSLPRRVIDCGLVNDPLEFCAHEDAAVFPARCLIAEVLADVRTPFYTLMELAKHLTDFSVHLDSNHTTLLQNGHPHNIFLASPWLDVWLNKMYPVKIPIQPGKAIALSARSMYDYRYVDRRRVATPATLQRAWRSMDRDWGYAGSSCGIGRTASNSVWGRWTGMTAKVCEYDQADYMTGLTEDDAEWLGSMRPTVFALKLQVLRELRAAASAGNPEGLWERCWSVVSKTLLAEQAKRLLRLDTKYLGYNILSGAAESDLVPCVAGGLTNVLEIVGHVEKELLIGTMWKTREALGNLIGLDACQRPQVAPPPDVEPYLLLASGKDCSSWRKAIDLYAELEHQERDFWVGYRVKCQEAVDANLQAAVVIPVKPKHRSVLEPMLKNSADEITRKLESGELGPGKLTRKQTKAPTARFPSITELRWEEVTIAFISKDSIRISARGQHKVFTFAELGFKDNRKGDLPDSLWEFLMALAKLEGFLQLDSDVAQKKKNRAKWAVKEIRKRLRAVVHIGDDPFEQYRKVNGYKTKFKLLDQSFAQDQPPDADSGELSLPNS